MFIPVINEKDCNQCRACAKICPKAVFDVEKDGLTVSNPAFSTGCESCTAICPKAAVRIDEF